MQDYNLSTAETPEFERQLPKETIHRAVISSVIELGTQTIEWEGNIKQVRQVEITYELAEKATFNPEDGLQPFLVSKKYTMSMNPKSGMYKVAKAVFNPLPAHVNPFDLLGKSLMVNVIHKESNKGVFPRVDSVAPLMEDVLPLEPVKKIELALHQDFFDKDVFLSLPEWKQNLIKASPEFKALDMPF